jgi:hypothetical protein
MPVTLCQTGERAVSATQPRKKKGRPGQWGNRSDDPSILQELPDQLKQGDHVAQRELLDRACARQLRLPGTEWLTDDPDGVDGFL